MGGILLSLTIIPMMVLKLCWSKSKFTSGPLCDTLVNNMLEAFNSTIVIPRGKPIVTMCEDIRIYMMERWEANR